MSRMDTLRFLANFYPRSPCGERLGKSGSTVSDTLFLSTLSLRRATLQDAYTDGKNLFLSTLSLRRATAVIWFIQLRQSNFYPRSPCGERHVNPAQRAVMAAFLSTLSLRRATFF